MRHFAKRENLRGVTKIILHEKELSGNIIKFLRYAFQTSAHLHSPGK